MATGHNVHLLPQTDQLRAIHTIIRDKDCAREDFVFYSRRVVRLLLEAGMDLLPFTKKDITTPVGATYHGLEFATNICAVPVIRAGEAMEDELRDVHPGIRIGKERPYVKIVTSAIEDRLNEHAFMIPGIGDFGDRFFGTTDCGAGA